MAKAERLELRLDVELREKLDALAKLRDVTASVVVRRAILDAHRAAFPNAPVSGHPRLAVRSVPSTPPDTLTDFHARLWGRPPSDSQSILYAAHGRGYVHGVTDVHVDAVLTTAFYIAPVRPNDAVAILAPPDATKLIEQRIIAAVAAARTTPLAGPVTETFERMKMGLPLAWWSKEPRVWVAMGLTVDETTPAWLQRRLVPGPSEDRDGGRAPPDAAANLEPVVGAPHE